MSLGRARVGEASRFARAPVVAAAVVACADVALVAWPAQATWARVWLYGLALGAHGVLAWLLRPLVRHGRVAAGLPRMVVWGLVATVGLAAWTAPPRTSRDSFAYVAYGHQVVAHQQNPYTTAPSALDDDPFAVAVDARWRDTKAVYGPAWMIVSAGAAAVGGNSPDAAARWLRLCVLECWFVLLALVDRARGAGACVLVGLWPPAVTYGVNDGHADVALALCLLAAAGALVRSRWLLSGVLAAIAVSIKAVAGVPAVALGLAALAIGRARGAARWCGAFGALGVAMTAPWGIGAYADALGSATGRASRAAIWEWFRLRWTHSRVATGELGRIAGPAVRDRVDALALVALGAVAVSAVALLLARRRAGDAAAWGGLAGVVGLAVCVVAPYVLPWYLGAAAALLLAGGIGAGAWLWGGYLGLAYLAPWSRSSGGAAQWVLDLTSSGRTSLAVGLAALALAMWRFDRALVKPGDGGALDAPNVARP